MAFGWQYQYQYQYGDGAGAGARGSGLPRFVPFRSVPFRSVSFRSILPLSHPTCASICEHSSRISISTVSSLVLSSATSSRKPSFSATSVSVKAVEAWDDDELSEASELLEACESSRLRDPPPELPLSLSLASSSEPSRQPASSRHRPGARGVRWRP